MTLDLRPHARWWRVALTIWLGTVTWIALHMPMSPHDDQAGFSLSRATASLRWIASDPHPVGTNAHVALGARLAREFAAFGLTVTTQEATYIDGRPGNHVRIV